MRLPTIPTSRRRRGTQESRSSPRAERAVRSNILQPRRMSCPSAGPRSAWAARELTDRRRPGPQAAEAIASTSRSRAIRTPSKQTGMRSTPDVAFDGDPSTGVEVYSTPQVGTGELASRRRDEPGCPCMGRDHRDRRSGPRARGQGEPGRSQPDLAGTLRRCFD